MRYTKLDYQSSTAYCVAAHKVFGVIQGQRAKVGEQARTVQTRPGVVSNDLDDSAWPPGVSLDFNGCSANSRELARDYHSRLSIQQALSSTPAVAGLSTGLPRMHSCFDRLALLRASQQGICLHTARGCLLNRHEAISQGGYLRAWHSHGPSSDRSRFKFSRHSVALLVCIRGVRPLYRVRRANCHRLPSSAGLDVVKGT